MCQNSKEINNLKLGLEIQKELFTKSTNKENIIKVYGNLRVLEFQASMLDDSTLFYEIQDFISIVFDSII